MKCVRCFDEYAMDSAYVGECAGVCVRVSVCMCVWGAVYVCEHFYSCSKTLELYVSDRAFGFLFHCVEHVGLDFVPDEHQDPEVATPAQIRRFFELYNLEVRVLFSIFVCAEQIFNTYHSSI